MNSGVFIKNRRTIFWTIFVAVSLSVLAILLIPAGSHSQHVPPNVTIQGISRPEAERLYGYHESLLRRLIWYELRQLEFKQAWHRIQILRYSHVEAIRRDTTNVAILTMIYVVPGGSTSTNEEKLYFRYATSGSPAKP